MPQEPLNFKLSRVTPKWAFKQSARRFLVITFFLVPFVAGTAAGYINSLWSLLFAPFAIVPIVCFLWLVGATGARADSPDEYLDERERSLRDHAHRIAYWVLSGILGGIFGLVAGFISTREAEYVLLQVSDFARLDVLVYLLAFWALFLGLPTTIIAWLEPDPLEDEETQFNV